MKAKTRFSLLLLIVAALGILVLAGCSSSYSPVKGAFVTGGNYTLQSGDSVDGLTIMGGSAVIEDGATVNGDLTVMGGSADINGTINGDIAIMGGSVNLGKNSVVYGNISKLGGSITRADGSRVEGSMNRVTPPAPPAAPVPPVAPVAPSAPRVNLNLDPILRPIFSIFQSLGLAALAVLVGLFASRPMERVAQAVQSQPVVSGGIGLLSLIAVPVILLILAITIILSPLSLLGVLLMALAVVFGFLSIGLLAGRRIAELFHQNWSDPLAAGVGTLALSLVVNLFNSVACIGWLVPFTVGILGLGAVVVTRFGMQDYRYPAQFPGSPFSGAPSRPAAPRSPAAPYDTTGGPATTQYYAPRVYNPSAELTAEPVPPVTTAPDLSFLNEDYSEKKPEEGQNGAQPGDDNKPDEPTI